MPFYSATSTDWPLLQSKTEQKFKSGLIAVSAEYISPLNSTGGVSFVPSSIGDLAVATDPTVSTGTDGFARINAVGYGVWAPAAKEEMIIPARITMDAWVTTERTVDRDPDPEVDDIVPVYKYYGRKINIFAETGWVKAIGGLQPLSRPLGIFQEKKTWSCLEVFGFGPTTEVSPTVTQNLSSIRQNKFGTIIETESTYEVEAVLDFGTVVISF